MNTDSHNGSPKKKPVNMLDYFGVKQFSILSFVVYLASFVGVMIGINLIFYGGTMSILQWSICSVVGTLIGIACYFWAQ